MDIGTDIGNDWSLINGDLVLVSDEGNLSQSIMNRLKTYKPNLGIFYQEYGGFLSKYFGEKRTDETLNFLKIDLETILEQEERIQEFETVLDYNSKGDVEINLKLTINDGEDFEMNLLMDDNELNLVE